MPLYLSVVLGIEQSFNSMNRGHYQAVIEFLDDTMLEEPEIRFQWERDGTKIQDVRISVRHTKNPDNWTYTDLAFYRKWVLAIPAQMRKVEMNAFTGIIQEMTEEVAEKVQARLLSDPTLNDTDLHTYP